MADRFTQNPFYVLGLRPGATRAEIEQEGQKLIGMLALELAGAATYDTPLGPRPRSADLVRQALAELREPDCRLHAEIWARLPPDGAAAPPAAGFDALRALGWRR